MKNQITEQDMIALRDIAANQLSPLKKMTMYIHHRYKGSFDAAKETAKNILDEVAAELGFQTKFSEPCTG